MGKIIETLQRLRLPPVLRKEYDVYARMHFEGDSENLEVGKKELIGLVRYISEDEKLRGLATLSSRRVIRRIIHQPHPSMSGPITNLNIDGQGLYLFYRDNPRSMLSEESEERDVTKNVKKFFPGNIDAEKLRKDVLEYIQKAPYEVI